jgi:hypothetical protein
MSSANISFLLGEIVGGFIGLLILRRIIVGSFWGAPRL